MGMQPETSRLTVASASTMVCLPLLVFIIAEDRTFKLPEDSLNVLSPIETEHPMSFTTTMAPVSGSSMGARCPTLDSMRGRPSRGGIWGGADRLRAIPPWVLGRNLCIGRTSPGFARRESIESVGVAEVETPRRRVSV